MKLKEECCMRTESFGGIIYNHNKLEFLETNITGYLIAYILKRYDVSIKNLGRILNALFNTDVNDDIKYFIKYLVAEGCIINGKNNEELSVRYIEDLYNNIYDEVKQKPKNYYSSPIVVQIAITNRCNAHCPHCYAESGRNVELDIKELKKILNVLRTNGVFSVEFTGGEPLLHPHFIDLMKYAYENGFSVSFPTNGSLLTYEILKSLKELGHKEIRISLDSPYPTIHNKFRGIDGLYETILKSIKDAKELGFKVAINYVLMKFNTTKKFLEDMIDLAISNNVDEINFIRQIPYGRSSVNKYLLLSPSMFNDICRSLESYKKKYENIINIRITSHLEKYESNYTQRHILGRRAHCSAAISFCYINPDGDVYPCNFLAEDKFKMGNILDDDWYEIWHTKNNYIKKMRNIQKIKGCENCRYFQICRGGCRAASYHLTGDLFNKDPFCLR